MTRQAVQLAAKFYDARDAMWRMAGADYEAQVQPARDRVDAVAKAKHGGDHVKAAMELLEAHRFCGTWQLWVLAAVVDLIERGAA